MIPDRPRPLTNEHVADTLRYGLNFSSADRLANDFRNFRWDRRSTGQPEYYSDPVFRRIIETTPFGRNDVARVLVSLAEAGQTYDPGGNNSHFWYLVESELYLISGYVMPERLAFPRSPRPVPLITDADAAPPPLPQAIQSQRLPAELPPEQVTRWDGLELDDVSFTPPDTAPAGLGMLELENEVETCPLIEAMRQTDQAESVLVAGPPSDPPDQAAPSGLSPNGLRESNVEQLYQSFLDYSDSIRWLFPS